MSLELSLEALLALVAVIVSPMYATQAKIFSKISNLCERVAKEETKSKFYHKD